MTGGYWRTLGGRHVFLDDHVGDNPGASFVRVAVIDPEDRDAVERLMSLMFDHGGDWTDAMQAALRKLADPKPPKCSATVNIAGSHFGCVEDKGHGAIHRNPDGEVVWGGDAS